MHDRPVPRASAFMWSMLWANNPSGADTLSRRSSLLSQLLPLLASHGGRGLDTVVAEGGSNLSVGPRPASDALSVPTPAPSPPPPPSVPTGRPAPARGPGAGHPGGAPPHPHGRGDGQHGPRVRRGHPDGCAQVREGRRRAAPGGGA